MVLQRSQVAGAKRRVGVGRGEKLLRAGDRGVLRGLVPVGARLVERRVPISSESCFSQLNRRSSAAA
jgi:hypothetical protein